jgi:hypothetical protein
MEIQPIAENREKKIIKHWACHLKQAQNFLLDKNL